MSESALQLQPTICRGKTTLRHSISEIAVQLQLDLRAVIARDRHSISEIAVQLQHAQARVTFFLSHSISEIAVQLPLQLARYRLCLKPCHCPIAARTLVNDTPPSKSRPSQTLRPADEAAMATRPRPTGKPFRHTFPRAEKRQEGNAG